MSIKKIFKEIKNYTYQNNNFSNIIIAEDYNQDIHSKETMKFHKDIGVKNTHAYLNDFNST